MFATCKNLTGHCWRIITFVTQILSGFSAYLLVKEITDNQRAGLIAGLVNSLSPWHVFLIVCFNRFPHNFIYTLMPLVFYFYERYRKGKESLLRTARAGGFTFFLIFAFQYRYALFITIFYLFYIILDVFRSPCPKIIFNNAKLSLVTGIVALGLSLFLIVPLLTVSEQNLYGIGIEKNVWKAKSFQMDSADFETLYARKGRPVYHKGYIGAGFAILSLLGVVEAFRRKRFGLIILYGLAIFLVLGHKTSFYKHIPLIYTQKGTERLIIYQIFFMAILAGFGWNMIEEFLHRRKNTPFLSVSVFVLVAFILIWDVSVMFDLKWRSDYYDMKPVYESLKQDMEKRGDNHGRAVHIFRGTGIDWIADRILSGIQVLETSTPSLQGFSVIFGLTRSWVFIEAGIEWMKDELNKYHDLRNSTDFLYLMDTAYLILRGPSRWPKIANLPSHLPVLASGNVLIEDNQGKDPKEFCRSIVPKMGIDKITAAAQTLFSLKTIPDYKPLPHPRIKLLKYQQTINHTHLKIEFKTDTYLRISHTYYQYLILTLDEKPVPFYSTSL